jgi:hypothetical protein
MEAISEMVALISSVAIATDERLLLAFSILDATESVFALICSDAVATVAALLLISFAPAFSFLDMDESSVDDDARV